jgi:predicted metalloendopeptidase
LLTTPSVPQPNPQGSDGDASAVARAVALLHASGVDCIFGVGDMPDKKNSSHSIAALGQGGLGLPDKDYYLSEDADRVEIREKYRAHVAAMLSLVGGEYANPDAAKAGADGVIKLETAVASAHLTPAERRDAERTYNKFASVESLPNNDAFPWRVYFEALGKAEPGELNVSWPDALVAATDALVGSAVDKKAVLAYATFHCASSAASSLSDDFVDEDFAFFGKELNGQKELKPRWKRVVSQANGAIGELVGQKYVERHFPEHAKDAAVRLVKCVRDAVEDRLRELPWISDATKTKALEKMAGFRVKIGYPDIWTDYDKLKVLADAPYYANCLAAQRFEHARMLTRIDAPVDRERWFMAPQQVNAYYHPMLNEIVFPAAILQPPFFDPAADPAINFGAIGAVIGHEITHGFDDQGRKYDADGNMNDWWQPGDAEQFNARAAVIVKQADDTVVHTQDEECEEMKAGPFSLAKFGVRSVMSKECACRNVNGELTQGENIADLGGLRLAYRAWGKYQKVDADGANAPDNFPEDSAKRFFYSWATIWRQNITAKLAAKYIAVDPHAPPEVRVNGTVSNMPEFAASFDLKEDDALYRTEDARVDIW